MSKMRRTELIELSTSRGCLCFTEDNIAKQRNKFAPVDARMLPREGKGVKHRSGNCAKCGASCWPYSTCADCREKGTLHRILKKMENTGDIERVTDGRGRKGGAEWRMTDEGRARAKARKKARTVRRASPKVGRNELCPCGSGRKHKQCCLHK